MSTFSTALADLTSAQKAKRGVSAYSRFINRPLGRVLAAACYSLRVTPNQVTAASAVVTAGALAALILIPAASWRGFVVAALLVLGFALDSADGQVSRLTGTSSRAGEWLDHVVDAGKMVAVHGAVLVAFLVSTPLPHGIRSLAIALPLAFQLVAVVIFAGGIIVELLLRADASTAPLPRPTSATRALALLPADFGVLSLSFALFGWPTVFVTVYGLLLVANLAIAVLLLSKWFRALS